MPYSGNIVQDFSVNNAMLNTDSVTSIKIDDGTIVNADINDSAAIAGTKISPDFGSQNITTTGIVKIADGYVSAPALAFTDDLDTGIFSVSQNTINFTTAGVERLEMGTSLTVFNEDGADVDFRVESDTNANFFKIDAGSEQASFGGAATASGYTLEVIRSTTEAYVNATDSTLRLNNTNTSANNNQASLHFSVSTTSTGADASIVAQAEDSSGNSRLEFYTDDANV